MTLITVVGCGNSTPKEIETLSKIEQEVEQNRLDANAAYDSLLAIPKKKLSKSGRMYYDFMDVKLRDKAFMYHKSDSLIMQVIDYYASHENEGRYTEALYYGGRVYSDMGDYPSAIRYFGDALNRVGDDYFGKVMKGKIVAQMAGVMKSLRLYEEMRRYIDMVIDLDKELKDSLNLIYDLEVSGGNYIYTKNYDAAETEFHEAISIAARKAPLYAAVDSAYLAGIKLYKGNVDSAVLLIKNIPHRVTYVYQGNLDCKQLAYSYAAEIYKIAKMPDSAYKYALELSKLKDARNQRLGYSIMLSEELKDIVPLDSIREYVRHYRRLTEQYMSKNGDRYALIQNSQYNYDQAEREKRGVLEKKRKVEAWLAISLIVLLLFVIILFYYRDKSHRTLIQLRRAIDNSRRLRLQLEQEQSPPQVSQEDVYGVGNNDVQPNGKLIDNVANIMPSEEQMSKEILREQLVKELQELCHNTQEREPLSPIIRNSDAYSKLSVYIEQGKIIADSDPLWGEIQKVVLETSPNFIKRIQLLSLGKVKNMDYHIMLLIKLGLTPTQLGTLIGRSKGAVAYRRQALGIKLVNLKTKQSLIDNLIYAL